MEKVTSRRWRRTGGALAAVAAGAILLAACSSSGSSSASANQPSGGAKQAGGTAYWAELPGQTPNMIFPFDPSGFFSVANINQFQYLMYRPLYWFGEGNTAKLNLSLSVAQAPSYSNNNTTVTFNLNPYTWSNGEKVTAQDVVFWMNMMHAEKTNYGAYVPGINAIPDDVSKVVASGPEQVTMTLTGTVNTNWYTYNNLSQITPMPIAWDITSAGGSPGSGGCSSAAYGSSAADAACAKVWAFLAGQAGYNPSNPSATNNAFGTYATNPIWQVVDGPWHLTSFNADGQAAFAPNPHYTGPQKPTLAQFVELPYTSESAEYNALLGGKVNVGYLPLANEPKTVSSPLATPGQDPRLSNFYLAPYYGWEFSYFPINFNSSGGNGTAGKLISQLYIRQALQTLIDQPQIIKKIFKGYGLVQDSPMPPQPPTYLPASLASSPYPYDPAKAKQLLTSHGWKVNPNGTDTCQNAGTGSNQCGAGIPAGTPLTFNLEFATGITTQTQALAVEISSWESAGIHINETTANFDTVIGHATACSGGPSCTWEMEDWAGSWVYAPDYYPTGEELFATGAVSNYGSYSDPTADSLIKATDFSNQSLDQYAEYMAKQLPVIYLPQQVQGLVEIQNNLRGVTPINILSTLTPESWYYVK